MSWLFATPSFVTPCAFLSFDSIEADAVSNRIGHLQKVTYFAAYCLLQEQKVRWSLPPAVVVESCLSAGVGLFWRRPIAGPAVGGSAPGNGKVLVSLHIIYTKPRSILADLNRCLSGCGPS